MFFIHRPMQVPIPLHEGQWVTSWCKPAIQTNRDPIRDKILARSNHPRTSKNHRRQDDVFGYELQFLLFKVLPGFQKPPKKRF